jgi:hypothetical protein
MSRYLLIFSQRTNYAGSSSRQSFLSANDSQILIKRIVGTTTFEVRSGSGPFKRMETFCPGENITLLVHANSDAGYRRIPPR